MLLRVCYFFKPYKKRKKQSMKNFLLFTLVTAISTCSYGQLSLAKDEVSNKNSISIIVEVGNAKAVTLKRTAENIVKDHQVKPITVTEEMAPAASTVPDHKQYDDTRTSGVFIMMGGEKSKYINLQGEINFYLKDGKYKIEITDLVGKTKDVKFANSPIDEIFDKYKKASDFKEDINKDLNFVISTITKEISTALAKDNW
jgi:hypothetical protein